MTEPKIKLFKIKLADGYDLPPIYPQRAELNLVIDPDPRLRLVSSDVKMPPDNSQLDEFIAKMIWTMYAANGVGLAAPQVGTNERIIVFDSEWGTSKKFNPMALLNPVILDRSEETQDVFEGCLSVGCHYYTNVKRAAEVWVLGFDLKGEEVRFVATDLLAAIIQHEVDHLDGVLFIDSISSLKLGMLARKKSKLKKKARRIASKATPVDLSTVEP